MKNKYNLVNLMTLFLLSMNAGCQVDSSEPINPAITNPVNNTVITKAKPTPRATPAPSKLPGEPDENEIIGTDTEAVKTNVNWKIYNPVILGKKYTYIYTIKEGASTVQTDILREIIEVDDKSYKFRQSIITSGKDSQLRSTEISITLNNDFSPPIIPPLSVGGASITPTSTVEVSETPEKVKVPLKEYDAIKVISKSGDITTTNWYGKDTGLIKAVQVSKTETHTLELKEYK